MSSLFNCGGRERIIVHLNGFTFVRLGIMMLDSCKKRRKSSKCDHATIISTEDDCLSQNVPSDFGRRVLGHVWSCRGWKLDLKYCSN